MFRIQSKRKSSKPSFIGCVIESLESRRLLNAVTVTVPAGGSVAFSAPDGTLANIQFAGCSGSVTFQSSGSGTIEQSTLHNGVPIIKGDASVQGINVTGGTGSINVRAHDPKQIPLGTFTATSQLVTVNLSDMTLEGDLDAPGIAKLTIGSLNSANVQVAGNIGTVKVGTVTNSTWVVGTGIESMTTGNWVASEFTAASMGKLNVAGSWSGNLNLGSPGGMTEVLDSAMISGDVTGGSWNVHGNTWYVGARSFDQPWNAHFGGYVTNLKATKDLSGDITAGSIYTATIGNNLSNANIDLTYAYSAGSYSLKNWTIGNTFLGSDVWGPGSFGTIKTMFMSGSRLLAGVNSDTSYTFLGSNQFVSSAWMQSLSVHCHSGHQMFSDSVVAAPSIESLNIGNVQPSNFTIPFGVQAGTQINNFMAGFLPLKKMIDLTNVTDASALKSALQSAGITPGDFHVGIGDSVM